MAKDNDKKVEENAGNSSNNNNNTNINGKKRKISRKERKLLKKQRLKKQQHAVPQKQQKQRQSASTSAAVVHDDAASSSATNKKIIVNEKKIQSSQQKSNNDHNDDSHDQNAAKNVENNQPNNGTTEEIDYMTTYKPISPPSPQQTPSSTTTTSSKNKKQPSSLGKWFPKAQIIKIPSIPSSSTSSLLLFYQYISPPWPSPTVSLLTTHLLTICQTRRIGGRIRIAPEGLNCTVSCGEAAGLRHFAEDLRRFDDTFKKTDFKYIDELPPDRHFKDLKLLPVKELVFYGAEEEEEEDATTSGESNGGIHLSPTAFNEKLSSSNAVVIDVRNHYEAVIGRFSKQEKSKGATYVDPKMRKSTDFPKWLDDPTTKETLKGKEVLMYCTGGIRCEKASVILKKKLGEDVGGVYQLQGGIERYFKTFKDGGYWEGKNFVFDKREAVDVSNPAGDGGVVRRADNKKSKTTLREKEDESSYVAKCCLCLRPWDRYVGKKKCQTCGVPVLVCPSCLSRKKVPSAKTAKQSISASDHSSTPPLMRCPLCISENITVPVDDVTYTENGKSSLLDQQQQPRIKTKAAPSVLKWGGGHAAKKKEKKKCRRIPCQFGLDCIRKDCLFAHPEREEQTTTTARTTKVG